MHGYRWCVLLTVLLGTAGCGAAGRSFIGGGLDAVDHSRTDRALDRIVREGARASREHLRPLLDSIGNDLDAHLRGLAAPLGDSVVSGVVRSLREAEVDALLNAWIEEVARGGSAALAPRLDSLERALRHSTRRMQHRAQHDLHEWLEEEGGEAFEGVAARAAAAAVDAAVERLVHPFVRSSLVDLVEEAAAGAARVSAEEGENFLDLLRRTLAAGAAYVTALVLIILAVGTYLWRQRRQALGSIEVLTETIESLRNPSIKRKVQARAKKAGVQPWLSSYLIARGK